MPYQVIRDDPADRGRPLAPWLLRLRSGPALDLEQFLRLGAEAAELRVVRLVLLHPPDRLVVPLAGFGLMAQSPVGHGQECPVQGLAATLQPDRPVQRLD